MAGLAVLLVALPWLGLYPYVLAQVLCFALFACAFNMMLGFGGLLSFGHAMFFGFASYVAAHTAKNGLASLPFWLPRRWLVRHPNRPSALRAGTRDPVRGRRCRAPRLLRRLARDPPARHLLCHDHARARTDGLFLLPAGPFHRRRERHSGRSARRRPSVSSISATTGPSITSSPRSS